MVRLKAFTIVELLVASAILVGFLEMLLVAFGTTLKTADYSQGLSLASSACQSKLEEIISHDFASIRRDYSAGGSPGDTFDFSAQGLTGKGSITITDRRDLYGGGEIKATLNASWNPRVDAEAIVYDNKMWILGGRVNTSTLSNDVWYSADGVNWTQATANASWSAREDHHAIVYDNKMWILGGEDNTGNRRNDVWYSSDGVKWSLATANANWSARSCHEAVVYNNRMWVMAGWEQDGTQKNDVWWSTDGVNWTQATASAAWPRRLEPVVLVYDNKMWLMGGARGGTYYNDVWWSTDGQNWTQATGNAGWSPRFDHVGFVYDNKMWVMAGWQWNSPAYNDIWYSTDGANWTFATNAGWQARWAPGYVVYDNKMWIMGGGLDTSYTSFNDVWYSAGYDRFLEVLITLCWKEPDNRLFGEDNDLDGVLDSGEDTNANGRLDSPAQQRIIISEKNLANLRKVFLGRQ